MRAGTRLMGDVPDAARVFPPEPAVIATTIAQAKGLGAMETTSRQRSPLARGLRLLDHLRERPATISELARLLEVNRSTILRLVRELRQAGYIDQDPASRRFYVGPEKRSSNIASEGADMGAPLLRKRGWEDWVEIVQHKLANVRDMLGESTMFSVPARDRMLYSAFFNNDHPVGVQEAIGSARPMHASAVGKAYLSALPASALDIVLGRLDYNSGTENAAKGPLQLRDRLEEARETGYAVDHDETFVGLSCVAVPVILNGSALVGAAGVTGLTHRFTSAQVGEFGALLLSELRHIETK